MDDAQAGARLDGLSRMPRQAAEDAALVRWATAQPVQDSFDAAFEQDLTKWLAALYAVRDERRLTRRLERINAIGWLAVTAATLAVPMHGLVAALAAVVLLCAMLVVAWRAAIRSSLVQPNGGLRVGARARNQGPR